MAKTIFDSPPPRPTAGRFMAAPEPKEIPSQAEEGVSCDPKMGMSVFNYLAPRKGIDAPGDFRSCASCENFVPERAFHAATTGNHCVLFGSFPVQPYANCFRYAPWPAGKPVEHIIEGHALACLNGSRSSLSPFEAGYCEDDDHGHKCRDCKHFDMMGDEDSMGPECEFAEELNRKLSNLFFASESVDPDGGCSAWAECESDEPASSGQES